MTEPTETTFVGRGGLKLLHACRAFSIDPTGMTCADFGCNVGGFTDCLLQLGATKVYAVDTGYGALAWKLRKDPRVIAMERTNALHASPPEPVDLIAIDLGWTPQRHAIPAALRWLKPEGRIISLIKPHYEVPKDAKSMLTEGILEEGEAERVTQRVVSELPALGVEVLGLTKSPITGGGGKKNKKGNSEWLALLKRPEPASTPPPSSPTGGE